jgi:UDP-N-acetylglucosamine--N-acetylmuramyl-(pentapeptide) pyrophosphoryl-undecaprenol N-acetylglucosamine transferase
MKIVAAGGGSAGHVTPVLAVLRELKRHDANLQAYFVTDHAFGKQAADVMAKAPFEVQVKKIYAGKFRRYSKISFWRQLIDVRTVAKNFLDTFLVVTGFVQSFLYLRKVKPDVVFTKGGYVCLPFGYAAHLLRIPIVIHDSDFHPGLTNRLLAKYASAIATGAPLSNYSYDPEKSRYVGVPVSSAFRPVKVREQQKCKAALGLADTKKPLLVVTGGGLGSRSLNHVVTTVAPQLLDKTAILHVAGQANYQEALEHAPQHADYVIKPFLPEGMALALAAADIVVSRAGATTMSELAASAKPTILVPSPYLPSGHQVKNAAILGDEGAALVLEEDKLVMNPLLLTKAVLALLDSPQKRKEMSAAIHKFAKTDAAIDTASMIVDVVYKAKKSHQKDRG